ncbi:hypothetical protein ASF61_06760 [Duganella sp. Leaf126]|nr:hypothetical protein ASF61_06760 [Duganella sp. Leaf126]
MQRIKEYAAEHDITIVAVYEDSGKSGLTMRGRPGLQQLLADVQTKDDFTSILVYDVSRWGRFQDVDESAHYEYICRLNGVQVTYCTESFSNDDSPYTSIIKAMKRIAAADYSRELSSKVFVAQCRIIRMGYKLGGMAGYGLRRALLDADGKFLRLMEKGEWKAVQTHRVVLVPGPKEEIEVVNLIFKWYAADQIGDRRIAAVLNEQNVASESGRPWTGALIRGMLRNEKYIGNLVFNKGSYKLKKTAVRNPPHLWVRCDGAFPPIVPLELFHAARAERCDRNYRYTTEELMATLQRIYREHGRITSGLIDRDSEAPACQLFNRRFGSLYKAYELAGIPGDFNGQALATRIRTLSLKAIIVDQVKAAIALAGASWTETEIPHTLRINDSVTVSIRVIRCAVDKRWGYVRWRINKRLATGFDFLFGAVLDERNEKIERYMLLSAADFQDRDISFTDLTRESMPQIFRPKLEDFFQPVAH